MNMLAKDASGIASLPLALVAAFCSKSLLIAVTFGIGLAPPLSLALSLLPEASAIDRGFFSNNFLIVAEDRSSAVESD